MKRFFRIIPFAVLIVPLLCAAQGRVVYSESFDGSRSLEQRGFRKIRDNGKDVFEVVGGELKMVCYPTPYKGKSYSRKIPMPKYGELNFEVKVNANQGEYTNYSLQMKFGSLMFAFQFPRWRVRRPAEDKMLHAGYISLNKYHKCRIRFKSEEHYAEYYVDDMENPVLVDSESNLKYQPEAELVIANYGLPRGIVTNHLRNLELKELKKKDFAGGENNPLKGTWIFHGMCSEEWKLEDLKKQCPQPVSVFVLETIGSHPETTLNKYDLQPKPPINPVNLPERIVFADMPLRPIPDYSLNNIESAVKKGAGLIVLNGFFTLNKGDFAGTRLGKMLPVDLRDPWKDPTVIRGAGKKFNTAFLRQGKGWTGVFLNRGAGSEEEYRFLLSCLKSNPIQ